MDDEKKMPFVLIVEDDRDIAAFYRHVMDLAGYRTEIATNGKIALEFIFNKLPDIVLLDLSLPGVSGAEILQTLKSDDRLKKTPAIVITGYSQMADQLLAEPDLVLSKPVSPSQLTDLVGRLCRETETKEKRLFEKNPSDKITGLYSRSFFINRLGCAVTNGKHNGENLFAVLLVSLDQDKGIKTRPDPKQKELLLREIAQTLKTNVRPTDTIARFGPDYFFILIENIHCGAILSTIADRIQRALAEYPPGKIQFSMGALLCDNCYNNLDEILVSVYKAHSRSKREGRSRCKILTLNKAEDANGVVLKLVQISPA